jgi:tRNA(fMet)-specific endonuclease VapC
MNRILIDTNIYAHALLGTPEVVSVLQITSEIGISAISIGELISGFKGGTKEGENREELARFLDSPRVKIYLIDEATAEFYGDILDKLRKAGTPIPTNDIWIGGVALQNGLKLFTKDQHFEKIPGLLLIA